MRKFLSALICALFLLSSHGLAAISVSMDNGVSVSAEKKDKKDKNKNSNVRSERRSPQEIVDDLKNIQWTKPPRSGNANYDKMFDTADKFMRMLRTVDDSVVIYSIRIVTSPAGDSILAPVDSRGNIRNKKEANAQTLAAVSYGTNVGLTATQLGLEMTANAVNIGADAVPLVGDAKRKKANVQIAKATKGFKLLRELIGTQRKIMEKYLATNSNLSSGDVDVEALTEMNVNVNEILTLNDDDFNALWEQENGE